MLSDFDELEWDIRYYLSLTEDQQWIKDTVYSIFHQGRMLDWYEYIGE